MRLQSKEYQGTVKMENNRKSAKVSLEPKVEDKDVEGKPFIRQTSNNYYQGRR